MQTINICGIEDCGVFTGSKTNNGIYRISRVSPSCSQKIYASFSGCIRDAKLANDFIHNDFEHSNHTRAYIGEWHSHPEDIPKPSSIDKMAIRKIYESVKSPFDIVLFAIIGRKHIYWGLYDGAHFSELKQIDVV
ncbi:Mov34/MPN/PAD-1 family protein [Bacteroides sp. D2]|uniref:Mov34/MPN/PAD-1 family protein n=1 Tax=Bacteroides uniformis TaxID=820 RepID=UPI0001BC7C9C